MAKLRMTQAMPYDSPGLWFFGTKGFSRIPMGLPTEGVTNVNGVG